MEQHAKLAAIYFGICFIFTPFPWASSTRVYNPKLIIDQITKLLKDLQEELKHVNNTSIKFRVEGPTKAYWEQDTSCTGSFLDVFTIGTQTISGHLSNNDVAQTSEKISKCVNILETEDCTELKKYHHKSCKNELKRQKPKYFVDGFLKFSKLINERHICKKSLAQEYNRRQDNFSESLDIC